MNFDIEQLAIADYSAEEKNLKEKYAIPNCNRNAAAKLINLVGKEAIRIIF